MASGDGLQYRSAGHTHARRHGPLGLSGVRRRRRGNARGRTNGCRDIGQRRTRLRGAAAAGPKSVVERATRRVNAIERLPAPRTPPPLRSMADNYADRWLQRRRIDQPTSLDSTASSSETSSLAAPSSPSSVKFPTTIHLAIDTYRNFRFGGCSPRGPGK